MTDNQPDPMQQHRAVMRELLDTDGPLAIINYVQGFDSDPLRRVLYIASNNVIAPPDFDGKELEALIVVSDSGLAEMDRQLEEADDDEERAGILHAAHIVGYNLAAELADCWPNDDLPRAPAHHERGVRAANECLRISEAAGRPGPIANDYWVRGIHELALGQTESAIQSWAQGSEYAVDAARANGQPAEAGPEGTFLVNLTSGYLGLARWIGGDDAGENTYETSVAAFRTQLDDPERAEDAGVGLGQLEKTRSQYGP